MRKENRVEVVEVSTDRDLIVGFADGTKYAVLEGMVPKKFEKHNRELTSDVAFIMDVTTDDWKFVGWYCGITLMGIDNIIEICKEMKG